MKKSIRKSMAANAKDGRHMIVVYFVNQALKRSFN
jgi:hypothetical protein